MRPPLGLALLSPPNGQAQGRSRPSPSSGSSATQALARASSLPLTHCEQELRSLLSGLGAKVRNHSAKGAPLPLLGAARYRWRLREGYQPQDIGKGCKPRCRRFTPLLRRGRLFLLNPHERSEIFNMLFISCYPSDLDKVEYHRISLAISIFGCIFGCVNHTPKRYEYQA